MAAPDSEILAEFEKCKKLQKSCELLQLSLNYMIKPGQDAKKILEKCGCKKSSATSSSSYAVLGNAIASCSKDSGFKDLDYLFEKIGSFEMVAGKYEDVFFEKIKSGLLSTCNTFLEVTFPSLTKEMKALQDLNSSLESSQKKFTKEKRSDKQAKLEAEMKSLEVKCNQHRSEVSNMLKQANRVEQSIRANIVNMLTQQAHYYQLCLQNANEAISKLDQHSSK
nr:expressed protein [Hymenolepis microstoma]